MRERQVALAHALLGGVEALPPGARGALVVSSGGRECGAVLAEDNRVCWATAIGLERRLRQLLGHAGSPTLLVAQGLLSPSAVHAAMRQHSIESLAALCDVDAPHVAWVARNASLRAPTSFAPTELLAAVGEVVYADEADAAEFSSIHPSGTAGATFVIGDRGELVVVREIEGERLGVATLRDLGSWAAVALDATPGFTPKMVERALQGATASVAVGWRSARRVIHAIVVDDRATLAAALAAIRHRTFPLVVSVCTPWKLKHPIHVSATP